MHMLWLSEDASLDQALDLASKNDHCHGLAAKNAAHKPRFALRFLDVNEFRSAAKKLGLPDSSAGALTLLESKQWQVVEILYFSEVQCVFLSKTPGNTGPMFYQQAQGHRKQLVFKALNTLARQQLADANKNARASAAAPPQDVALAGRPSRAVERDRWCRRWQLVLLERQRRSPPGMRRKKSVLRTSAREKRPMLRGCALTKLNNCKSHLSCLWFLPSRTRNRYMHALHGNAARGCVRGRRATDHDASLIASRHLAPSTSQGSAQLQNAHEKPFSCLTLNTGGFNNAAKWAAVRTLKQDIIVLTETQLQTHSYRNITHQFKDFHCIHSLGKDVAVSCFGQAR